MRKGRWEKEEEESERSWIEDQIAELCRRG